MLKEPPSKVAGEIDIVRESTAVLLLVLSLFLLLALVSYLDPAHFAFLAGGSADGSNIMGLLGERTASVLVYLLGWCSFVTVLWSILLGYRVWNDGWPAGEKSFFAFMVSAAASVLMAVACASIAAVLFGLQGGGIIGGAISSVLIRFVNEPGTILIGLAVFLLSLGFAVGIGTSQLMAVLRNVAALSAALTAEGGVLTFKGLRHTGRLLLSVLKFHWLCLRHAVVRITRGGSRAAGLRKERQTSSVENGRDEEFVLGDDEELPEDEYEDDEDDEDDYDDEDEGEEYIEFQDLGPPIISRRRPGERSAVRPLKRLRGKIKDEKKAKKAKIEEREFVLPTPELLVSSEGGASTSPQDTDLIKNSKRLEQALRNFNIGGRVTEVHPGPVITLYQFEPAAGIKVQRIINLADDLALALKVGSVRVFAPVPGKGTVGIEVPNPQREIVRLRDVLESDLYHQNNQAPLSLAFGKDTYGEPFVASLSKMPHLLIAGATGTGKSVCINSLLISLLYKNKPRDLRLILIDPKMLELSIYEDIPHLKAPVITLAKRARGVLWWAVEEMERRYKLMKLLGVRDISMYNRAVASKKKLTVNGKVKRTPKVIELEERDVIATGSPYEGLDREADLRAMELAAEGELEVLPRIVIVVDELADLMFSVGREIEELLTRLAQKARASGLHLILATQRPSVNVITGLIKANFPARISFKVASKIDARTVMDTSGAEKLLGQGDMLYLAPGGGAVKRLHAPYVSDKEVHDVVDWLRRQGAPDYDPAIEKMIKRLDEAEGASSSTGGDDEYDPLYDQALQIVVEKGQASTSMVQRIFRIGYNRAARILEMMERDGVVGPADGAKPRPVLIGSLDDDRH